MLDNWQDCLFMAHNSVIACDRWAVRFEIAHQNREALPLHFNWKFLCAGRWCSLLFLLGLGRLDHFVSPSVWQKLQSVCCSLRFVPTAQCTLCPNRRPISKSYCWTNLYISWVSAHSGKLKAFWNMKYHKHQRKMPVSKSTVASNWNLKPTLSWMKFDGEVIW